MPPNLPFKPKANKHKTQQKAGYSPLAALAEALHQCLLLLLAQPPPGAVGAQHVGAALQNDLAGPLGVDAAQAQAGRAAARLGGWRGAVARNASVQAAGPHLCRLEASCPPAHTDRLLQGTIGARRSQGATHSTTHPPTHRNHAHTCR